MAFNTEKYHAEVSTLVEEMKRELWASRTYHPDEVETRMKKDVEIDAVRHKLMDDDAPGPPAVPTRRDVLRELDTVERKLVDMIQQAAAQRVVRGSPARTAPQRAVGPGGGNNKSFLSELEDLQRSTARRIV